MALLRANNSVTTIIRSAETAVLPTAPSKQVLLVMFLTESRFAVISFCLRLTQQLGSANP